MNEPATSVMPLDERQNDRLQDAVAGLTPLQLHWVSGYAAGLAAAGGNVEALPLAPANDALPRLTVLFGSQTGNGEEVAAELAAAAAVAGFAAEAVSLADFRPAALKRESLVAIVVSTHGEGDPPDDAELFHEYLLGDRVPSLPGLRYTVLALGDSSYVNFCQTGREIDERLEALGAQRIAPRVDCDLDYGGPAGDWARGLVARLPDLLGDTEPQPGPRLHAVAKRAACDREHPFEAEILVNQKITGAGSDKDVRHIELSIEGSGLVYEPGDALAVIADNPPQLVDELLRVLGLDGETAVDLAGESLSLRTALASRLEITALSLGFLRAWAERADSDELRQLLGADDARPLGDFMASHQLVDVLRRYPAAVDAQDFASALRRMSPRAYSIASSPSANPGEVHLTVAAVRYEAFGRKHWGAASTMLADRLAAGERVSVFVEKNPRFRLPAPDVPIIMIGPGTGVAPFRAFVEERAEQRATGDSWLIFGDRTQREDFLYQIEWQRHLKRGNLVRLDVAFSRDQRRKVYVQDVLRRHGAEVCAWIDRGAVIYVCGDAKHMAGDVDAALVDVLAAHGGLDREQAAGRLAELRRSRRYQRDVY